MHPLCATNTVCCPDSPRQKVYVMCKGGKFQVVETSEVKLQSSVTHPAAGISSLDKSFVDPSLSVAPCDGPTFDADMNSLSNAMGVAFSVTTVSTTMAACTLTNTTASGTAPRSSPTVTNAISSYAHLNRSQQQAPTVLDDGTVSCSQAINNLFAGIGEDHPSYAFARALQLMANSNEQQFRSLAEDNREFHAAQVRLEARVSKNTEDISSIQAHNRRITREISDATSAIKVVEQGCISDQLVVTGRTCQM